MNSIPKLIESTLEDFGLLARQYAKLAAIKAKKSSRYGFLGMGMLGSAATLLIIVTAELIFSLSAFIVNQQQLAEIFLIASGMTAVLAIVFVGVGRATLKKIDFDPRASSILTAPEIKLPIKQLRPRGI